jgi:hypothetical protein
MNKSSKTYVAFFSNNKRLYLLMTNDTPHNIVGFETEEKALEYFTGGYNRMHDRGYESSMSACINFISFCPKIVGFNSLEKMIKVLKLNNAKLVHLSHVSGYYYALELPESAMKLYEAGKSPELITEKVD